MMHFPVLKVALCIALLLLCSCPAAGFAEWMLKEFCHVNIEEGAVIMNEEAEATAERSISVLRIVGDGSFVVLKEKDTYGRGEQLHVKISDTEGQFVFDVITKNADFIDGGCEHGERSNKDNAVLVMPNHEDEDAVSIQAAWALGHQKVQITSTVTLFAEDSSGSADIKARNSSKDPALRAPSENSGSGSGSIRVGSSDEEAPKSPGFFHGFMAILYSMFWYIIGAGALFLVFALYRLNTKGSRKMRGSKLS